jgi:hypothetical protein
MTKFETLTAIAIFSAALGAPAFAQPTHHSRIHVRHFRGAYNRMIGPSYYAVPSSQSERNLEDFEFNRSFPGGADPSNNPPS